MELSVKPKSRTRRAHGYSVSKRKDGRWEYAVTVGYNLSGNPKRVRGYAQSEGEARRAAQAIVVKKDCGGFVPTGENSTVGQWMAIWLDQYIMPNLEPKTYAFYRGFANTHIIPALGKLKLREISASHVQRLMNEAGSKGLSPSSVRGLRATIRAALQQAWKQGLVEHNVAARTTPPKIIAKDPVHLNAASGRLLAQACPGHHLGNLFLFALHTGVRIGEATGLLWDDIDFENHTVRIRHQLQRVGSKMAVKWLKSKSSRRTLAIRGRALEALIDQKSAVMLMEAELGKGFNDMGLVFHNPFGRPLDPKYVNDQLKALMKNIGLEPLSFHKLRHTAATMLVAAGVPLNQVKEQLGHSQISLTADLYAHAVDEGKVKSAETLDRVFREDND